MEYSSEERETWILSRRSDDGLLDVRRRLSTTSIECRWSSMSSLGQSRHGITHIFSLQCFQHSRIQYRTLLWRWSGGRRWSTYSMNSRSLSYSIDVIDHFLFFIGKIFFFEPSDQKNMTLILFGIRRISSQFLSKFIGFLPDRLEHRL